MTRTSRIMREWRRRLAAPPDHAAGIARTIGVPRADAAFYLEQGGTYPPNWPDIADLREGDYGASARAEARAANG